MAKKNNAQFVQEIADINENFPQWYTDVVLKTELVDYGPVKGSMVIRPYGYAIWENIQKELDKRFKETGHKNAYFPMLIPYSFLTREKEHIEGFAPEVALVTHYGEEELPEKLVVRPTSETIICEMYKKWVKSYRDLPVLINQWANVFRCEKTTRPFLRTSEFLWQEGHTLHRTHEEAEEETFKMLNVYAEFMKNVLATPVLTGKKTEKEKFAGANATYGMEAMMLDGKSLQAGTSHDLGCNFAKGFEIKYLDKDGELKFPYQTSWGVSTRLIGALIMAHGDQRGLALPPRVAPIQAIVIPIASHKDGELKFPYQTSWGVSTRLIGALIMAHGDQRGLALPPRVAPIQAIVIPIASHKEGVIEKAEELYKELMSAGIRAEKDFSDNTPGWKFNEWEMKGVPLRIEQGPRDIENGVVQIVRRDTFEKIEVQRDGLAQTVAKLLDEVHENMYNKAKAFMDSHIVTCNSLEEMQKALDDKCFVKTMWCGCPECESKIKELYSATARVMPFDQTPVGNKCVCCGKKCSEGELKVIYFARAY